MPPKKKEQEAPTSQGIKRLGGTEPKRINVSNQAVADELLAATKVLHIQQEENYRYRDHVQLLGGEIDALKKVVEEKQKRLNKKDSKIAELDDTILELRNKIKEITIERSAFKVLEDQNADMLKRFQDHMRNIQELERENKVLKASQTDVRAYADNKMSKAVEVEVKLNAQIQELSLKLSSAEIDKAAAIVEKTALQSTVRDLKQSLKMVNELRVEQVNRSRMTEYKTLRKIDELTSKFAYERDEKDKMRETVQLAQLRGDLLEERLSNALEAKETEQLMVETLVSQAEFSNDSMRTREQILDRENTTLAAQLKLSQKAVNDMIKRYKKLEGMYEEVKAIAARVHVGKQMPFMSIGRSLELTSQIQQQQQQQQQQQNSFNEPATATIRKPHPDAPPLRAKTPKPPVPDPLEATKDFVNRLGVVNQQLGLSLDLSQESAHSDGFTLPFEQSRSRDDVTFMHQGAGVLAAEIYPDQSRDLLDEGEDGYELGMLDIGTAINTSGGGVRGSTILPSLVTTDGYQHAGKRNLLFSYLQFLLHTQRSGSPVEQLVLAHFAITDDDFKMVIQCFRMMPLRKLRKIDLSHNLLTTKSVDSIAAWIISIAPQDLSGRTAASLLDIDLRHNQLTKRSIEKLGLKIRATPRPEIPLVAFEHDAYCIALYSPSAPLLKIDCRKNARVPGKPLIKEFVAQSLGGGSSSIDRLPVRMPGEPEDDFVYPRDSLFVKTL